MPSASQPAISTSKMLEGYASGAFLMANSMQDDALFWCVPSQRAILPLGEFHLPRRLARCMRQCSYEIRIDTALPQVIDLCRQNPTRKDSWINQPLRKLYLQLARRGHTHSVECWAADQLIGGLFGIELGAAFFGEAMFHLKSNASKIALFALHQRLVAGGFRLLDCQFQTQHLAQFGTKEVTRAQYQALLVEASIHEANFDALPTCQLVSNLFDTSYPPC